MWMNSTLTSWSKIINGILKRACTRQAQLGKPLHSQGLGFKNVPARQNDELDWDLFQMQGVGNVYFLLVQFLREGRSLGRKDHYSEVQLRKFITLFSKDCSFPGVLAGSFRSESIPELQKLKPSKSWEWTLHRASPEICHLLSSFKEYVWWFVCLEVETHLKGSPLVSPTREEIQRKTWKNIEAGMVSWRDREELMKSFKVKEKSLQDPPKLFFQFLMGKIYYAQVDLAKAFREKAAIEIQLLHWILFNF